MPKDERSTKEGKCDFCGKDVYNSDRGRVIRSFLLYCSQYCASRDAAR